MADVPEFPGRELIGAGGATVIILFVIYLAKPIKEFVVGVWTERRTDRQQARSDDRQDRQDAVEDARWAMADARAERDVAVKQVGEAKDNLAARNAECERHKVTIEYLTQRVEQLKAEAVKQETLITGLRQHVLQLGGEADENGPKSPVPGRKTEGQEK